MELPEIARVIGYFTIIFPKFCKEERRYKATGPTDVKVVICHDETVSFACTIREHWLGDKELSALCNARQREAIQVLSMTNYQYRVYSFCDHHGGRAREELELTRFLEEHAATPQPPEGNPEPCLIQPKQTS